MNHLKLFGFKGKNTNCPIIPNDKRCIFTHRKYSDDEVKQDRALCKTLWNYHENTQAPMPPDIRANFVCVIHKTLENCRLKSEAVSCQVTARHRCERGVQTCFYLSGVLMDTSSTQQTVSLFQKKKTKIMHLCWKSFLFLDCTFLCVDLRAMFAQRRKHCKFSPYLALNFT